MKISCCKALVILCLASCALAQTQPTGGVLKANSRLVLVDVVATDGKGVPVTGLSAQDFTVLEEGKPQEIRSLSFQKPNGVSGGEVRNERKRPPNVYSNVPSYKPDGALNIILLDALNTTSLNQATLHDSLLKVLQKLPGDRPVAVYALGLRLLLLQDFTTDPSLLQNALNAYKDKRSPLLENPTGGAREAYIPSSIAQSMPPGMLARVREFVEANVAATTDLRVDYTLNALQALARSLSGVSGRKNLIWISESFPLTITSGSTLDLMHGSRGDKNYGGQLARTADILINSQIALYTVDARGIVNDSIYSAGGLASTTDSMGRPLSNPNVQRDQVSTDNSEAQANRSTENDIAQRTGGQAFYNTNDFGKAIVKSMDDGSTYYTLAYSPENKNWDGKFRKIQVKTSRSGVKLRFRSGYFAGDPRAFEKEDAAQRNRDLAQALNLDFPASTEILFDAQVSPPSEATGNKAEIQFHIDPHGVVLEKQEDNLYHADLTCAVQIYSSQGAPMRTEAASLKANLPEDIYQRVMTSHIPCKQLIELPSGDYLLRLGIRDNRTGHMGTADAKVSIPAAAK